MVPLRSLIPALFLLLLVGAPAARAADPPLAWVGRVGAVEGALAVQPADGRWADSGVNDPIAAGMSVKTDAKSRAVLRIGAALIALAPGSELALAQLDTGGIRLVLHQGRVGVRVAKLDPVRHVAVMIPRGEVRLFTPGAYDIAAGDEHAPARVAVFDGEAHIVGKGIDTTIAAGAATSLSGQGPVVLSAEKAAANDFDGWWRAAYQPEDGTALRYVSPAMTGWEALDVNGGWRSLDGYGAVWFPKSLPADWAPYRFGHWRWIAPWGWNWVDDASWGFAPSHYGRWARVADPNTGKERWGWVPGKRIADPAYLPAAVAFLGTAGIGLSYPDSSGPALAWFPLAPGEVYWPSYTSDLAAIRRLNAGSVADPAKIGLGAAGGPPADVVNGTYKNRRFASVVPRPVFVAGRPVGAALIRLPNERLDNAPLLAGSPGITPVVAVAAAAAPKTAPKIAEALHTLARILKPHDRAAEMRLERLARRGRPRVMALARRRIARHQAVHHPSLGRAYLRRAHFRIVPAVARRRAVERRLRLAVARRR